MEGAVLFLDAPAAVVDFAPSQAVVSITSSETASILLAADDPAVFALQESSATVTGVEAEASVLPEMSAASVVVDTIAISGPPGISRSAGPTAVFGNGVSSGSVQPGHVLYVRLPYAGTISGWSVMADASCTCSIDVWKAHDAIPSLSDSITGGQPAALAAQVSSGSDSIPSWERTLNVGDVLAFSLASLSGSPKQIVVTLKVS